jgi:hypothetical protein
MENNSSLVVVLGRLRSVPRCPLAPIAIHGRPSSNRDLPSTNHGRPSISCGFTRCATAVHHSSSELHHESTGIHRRCPGVHLLSRVMPVPSNTVPRPASAVPLPCHGVCRGAALSSPFHSLNSPSALAKGRRVMPSSSATRVRNLSAEMHRSPALHCVCASCAGTTGTHPIPRAHVPRGDGRRNGACTARCRRPHAHRLTRGVGARRRRGLAA